MYIDRSKKCFTGNYTLSLHDALPILVVRVRDRSGLVGDHEHRVQLRVEALVHQHLHRDAAVEEGRRRHARRDRKSTRLNSSHVEISYAVFCLKKKMSIYSQDWLYTNE